MILHLIGNAHLDPVWLWRWPEGCAEAIGTCWAAVDRLEEHGGFIFTRGEACVYSWLEALEPELFDKIKEYVRAGRWAVVGGWWLQPDCNLPSGEAFLRQALYGKAYFERAFGDLQINTAYNVDSFGHAATLPMLLRHTGYEYYVFMRPAPHELALPAHLFDWCAPDGSRVLSYRIPVAYTTSHYPVAEALGQHQTLLAEAGHNLMCFYGVGNHGGGPTRENLKTIDAAQAQGERLEYSHPARYFERVKAVPRPDFADELQYHAIGCYAVVSDLKRLNRQAEETLALAEAGAALAAFFAGASYPHTQLRELWQTLLFNQFHDILGGTSLPSATEDAVQALGGVVQGTQEVLNTALRRLAAEIEAPPPQPGATFLAFNLTGHEQTLPLEAQPWLEWSREPHQLVDHSGNELPYQTLAPEGYMQGLKRIVFHAALPAYGYRLFRFLPGEPQQSELPEKPAPANVLETARWRLEVDAETGGLARLFDKHNRREVFSKTVQALVVGDPTDTWSHGVDRYGTSGETFTCERLTVIETGPLRLRVRAYTRYGNSSLTTDYLLYNDDSASLELRFGLDWREHHKLLRLAFPLALVRPEFRYEIPYGSLERPADGREWPGQRWVLATDADGFGVAFANDSKYSYAAQNGTLFVTAARSPVYAHHDPYPLADGEHPYIDQGVQRFTVRLLAGSRLGAQTGYRLADGLTRAPVTTPHVSRGGTWAQSGSLLKPALRGCVPVWLKFAEADDALVMRVLETGGGQAEVAVDSFSFAGRVDMSPYSLLSLKLDHEHRLTRCNGLERLEPE